MNNMEASKLMINSTIVVNTKNGILNEKQLMSKRDELIREPFNVMLDDFTDIKQSYPKNNLSNVNVSIDVVVLKREDYENFIENNKKLKENYIELKNFIQYNI